MTLAHNAEDRVDGLSKAKADAIDAYTDQLTAVRSLSSALEKLDSAIVHATTVLLTGGGTDVQVPPSLSTDLRSELNEALGQIEHKRRRTREALVRLALAEGRTMSDLARQWGVSRQYIWSLAHNPTTAS